MTIKRALISVSDKTGVVEFARFLVGRGVEILSTGGTFALLVKEGVKVKEMAEHTGFPEMLDGRVKTLHPMVHGGLLGLRDDAGHVKAMAEHGIQPIDLLVVNLYPFEATLLRQGFGGLTPAQEAEVIENIDIGGPAMIRAAAKNFAHVAVVVEPADYARVQQAMEADGVTLALRRELAGKAYARTSSYDTAIARYFAGSQEGGDGWPEFLMDATKAQVLRYGENPHQAAALYRTRSGSGVAAAVQLQGKELSYNNINDTDAAWQLVQEFEAPAVVLIKHANPCGVAVAADNVVAFGKALACDRTSAFGGILATNRAVDVPLVEAIGALFLEVIIAPEVTEAAKALLAQKKNLRVLVGTPEVKANWQVKTIGGGYLVQTADEGLYEALTPVVGAPSEAQLADMRFAFAVAKHVKSNAIVLAKDGATVGIGAGQMSRIDSVKIAVSKAENAGLSTAGAVLASDAFFPFADNVEAAYAAGVAAVVQPGGSMRDPEVIEAAEKCGLVMAFCGMRHFRH